jgi:hypothetical protein
VDLEQRVAEWAGVVAAVPALGLGVMDSEVLVVELLHWEGAGEEPASWDALGDPEIDGAVDWELDDVVG